MPGFVRSNKNPNGVNFAAMEKFKILKKEVDNNYTGKQSIINPQRFEEINDSLLPKGFSEEAKDKGNKEFVRRNKNIEVRKLPTKRKEKTEAEKKFAPYLEKNALPNSLKKKRMLLTTKRKEQKI